MEKKSLFHSKTLWVNFIALLALLFQSQVGFEITVEESGALLAVVNLILRFFTKQSIV